MKCKKIGDAFHIAVFSISSHLDMNFFQILSICLLCQVFTPKIDKTVSNTPLSQNIAWIGGVLFNFLSQIINIQADVMGLILILITPNLAENLVVGEYPTSIFHQVVE